MRRTLLLCSLLSLVPATAVVAANASSSAEADVRAALEHYLKGQATGQQVHFRAAFHPDAMLYSVRDGQVVQRTGAEYIAGVSGRPAADEAQRRRRIVSVDVSGSAAVARIELDYPAARFTDYMSLLKVGDEWKIVTKTFHVEPKPRP